VPGAWRCADRSACSSWRGGKRFGHGIRVFRQRVVPRRNSLSHSRHGADILLQTSPRKILSRQQQDPGFRFIRPRQPWRPVPHAGVGRPGGAGLNSAYWWSGAGAKAARYGDSSTGGEVLGQAVRLDVERCLIAADSSCRSP